MHQETIELVFYAIQHLPARQRGGVHRPGRDGLVGQATPHCWAQAEGVGQSALQRARAVMKQQLPQRRDELGRGGRGRRPRAEGAAALHRRPPARRHRSAGRGALRGSAGRLSADPPVVGLAGSVHPGDQGVRTLADYRFVAASANLREARRWRSTSGHQGRRCSAHGAGGAADRGRRDHRDRRLRPPGAVSSVRSRPDGRERLAAVPAAQAAG